MIVFVYCFTAFLTHPLFLVCSGLERILLNYPRILTYSVSSNLRPNISYFTDRLDLKPRDVPVLLKGFPPLAWLRKEDLERKLEFLETELGYDKEDMRGMILRMPQVLGLSLEKNLKPSLEYLREEIGEASLRESCKEFPSVLVYSLEGRVRPRVEELKRRGFEPRFVQVYVLGLGEERWKKWLEKQGETWTINE